MENGGFEHLTNYRGYILSGQETNTRNSGGEKNKWK